MKPEELLETTLKLAKLCEEYPEAKEAMLLTMKLLLEQPAKPIQYVPYLVYPQPVMPWWNPRPVWISSAIADTTTNARIV